MKTHPLNRFALALSSAATLVLASCSSTPPPDVGSSRYEYTQGVPGGVIVQTFKTTAIVMAIDQTKRTATLRGADGKTFAVKVGPAAVNFDQIRVGDQVNATLTQRIVAHLDKENTTAGDGAAAVVALAGKGEQPGGVIAAATQVTGTIIAIDAGRRTATLQFEDGSTETLPVRKDLDLGHLRLGQTMVFRVTEMLAINVEKSQ